MRVRHPSPSRCRAFRRSRVLIIGCGDVGLRAAQVLLPAVRVLALTSSAERVPTLRAAGVTPLLGNLDNAHSLRRLAGVATRVLHLAPPPSQGRTDPRTQRLIQALQRPAAMGAATRSYRMVYGSTSGVYGDAQGARFDETRMPRPTTDRGHRRVHAESLVRHSGRRPGHQTCILRIPGIYALDRDGGDPRQRVQRGSPVLQADDDVYTNHIHADDLARACVLALWRGATQRVIHVVDDQALKMGDYFDLVADLAGLPRLPRLSRQAAQQVMNPMQWSFMSESRQLSNHRLKQELRLTLRYPEVARAFEV
jgi:nucleoside-diphosphate-sugar epimerase